MIYTLVGLFKGDKFSYGRALVSPKYLPSFASMRIGYELNCREKLEKAFTVEIPHIGKVLVDAICTVESAIISNGFIERSAVFHLVDEPFLRKLECDVILGLDTIIWWGLIVDEVNGKVYSTIAKRFPTINIYR
jgi:hypothetical protein|uniref:Uncharacterized protein n=1 Tax=Ignisphaera aggregans TaxID=334771 RepID=A0A7J2U6C6_9CREN